MSSDPRPRRGWRERVEPGLYRSHRLDCPASTDRRPRRRCACPFATSVPDGAGGSRMVTLREAATIPQARRARAALIAAPPPRPPAPVEPDTLTAFAAAWLRAGAPVWAAGTLRNREADLRERILPPLGHLALGSVSREVVTGWLAELVATHPGRRRLVVQTTATLRACLGVAVEWQRITTNPATRLRLPPPEPGPPPSARVLDPAQVARLYDGCRSLRVLSLVRFLVETGVRRGEAIALAWDALDLPVRRATISRSAVQEDTPEGPRTHIGPPKGRRARVVALTPAAASLLSRWYAASVIEGGADAAGLVWPGAGGAPLHERTIGRALARAQVRAGLVDGQGRALVGPHALRHTCASIALSAGVPLPVVARQLGHADPSLTLRTYAHLLDAADLDRAADAFAGIGPDPAAEGHDSCGAILRGQGGDREAAP